MRLVREHARNAGDSAWLLGFSAHDEPPLLPATAVTPRRIADLAADPDGWLAEDRVMLVQR